MRFSKISVLVLTALATETLARVPGRYARRLAQDEVAQPTPAITPAPLLPAIKLKPRQEGATSDSHDKGDEAKTTTGAHSEVPGIILPTASGMLRLFPDLKGMGGDDDPDTTTVVHTSPRTTTSRTTYIFDDELTDTETTTASKRTSARTTDSASVTKSSTDENMDDEDEPTSSTRSATHARATGTASESDDMDGFFDDEETSSVKSSSHARVTSTASESDDMDSFFDDEETSSVKSSKAHATSSKSSDWDDDLDNPYTSTSSDDYDDYDHEPTTTLKGKTASSTPTGMEDDYPEETSTGYEPAHTTDAAPTETIPELSSTNAIDLEKFKANFGDSDSATIDCISLPEGLKQGVAVKDLINILKQPDNNVYTVDRSGCFQAKCIGDYGVLRLCNLKPKTGVMNIHGTELKVFLRFLLAAIRPNWESELSIDFNSLVYRPDAITFCGSSPPSPEQPMGKPRSPFSKPSPMITESKQGNTPKYTSHAEKIKMPLSYQPRFPNYWGENMGIPVARHAKFNGIISNADNGWAIVIDSASTQDMKCNNTDNFKATCENADVKDAEKCTWDNTVPKPYFVTPEGQSNSSSSE
ncbi:hypothetical protein TWF481_005220 [Arthrobotrys musiformis]|uniref:Uncharacterized protein n=1 Tax=Arthrobotrys musiformis TaxID=47236 RepID=A0AAV9WD17_9PEZI